MNQVAEQASLLKYSDMTTDAERVAFIKQKLSSSQAWLERSVVAIYQRQTAEEQAVEATRNKNGVGFSAFDAEFLSSVAKQIMNGRHLSDRQMPFVKKNMLKYAGQLVRIAEGTA